MLEYIESHSRLEETTEDVVTLSGLTTDTTK